MLFNFGWFWQEKLEARVVGEGLLIPVEVLVKKFLEGREISFPLCLFFMFFFVLLNFCLFNKLLISYDNFCSD